MDYGPFGFLERYDPVWSPFTSDPERKFGFERQPLAMQVSIMYGQGLDWRWLKLQLIHALTDSHAH